MFKNDYNYKTLNLYYAMWELIIPTKILKLIYN